MPTYYVSTTGSDGRTPTQAQSPSTPWLTINHARPETVAGDTVYIFPGTYAQELAWIGGPSGTSWSNPIVYSVYQSGAVTIRPNAGADRCLTMINSGTAVDDGHQYLIFNGFIFDGTNVTYDCVKITEWDGFIDNAGITPYGARHIKFTNFRITSIIQSVHPQQGILIGGNDVHLINGEIDTVGGPPGSGSNSQGIYGAASDLVVDRVSLHNIQGWAMSNINSTAGVETHNHTIRNCRIFNCPGGINEGEGTGHLIYNNTVYNNDDHGIYLGFGSSNGIRVYNNTVYNNGGNGIWVDTSQANTLVKNNICFGNGGSDFIGNGTTVKEYNLFGNVNAGGTNLYNVNPLFTNIGAGDFRLAAGSPAQDAGTTLADVPNDADGVTRPQGAAYDMGAYEAVGSIPAGGTIVATAVTPSTPADGTTSTATLNGVQAGDAIVVFGIVEGSETISFADDRANSYTLVDDHLHSTNSSPRARMMYALNCAAGTTVITMTLSLAQYRCLFAVAIRGIATTLAEEDQSFNEGLGTTPTTGSFTAVSDGFAIVGFGTVGSNTITPTSPWIQIAEQESGDYSTGGLAYRVSTAGSYDGSWTSDPGNYWVGIGVQLKAAAVAPAAVQRLLLMGIGS